MLATYCWVVMEALLLLMVVVVLWQMMVCVSISCSQ